MNLVYNLFVLLLITAITGVILALANMFVAWYENQGRPSVESVAENVGEDYGVEVNTSEYDLWERVKPYLEPLDIALAVAFLAAILGVFIYTKERT